MCGLRGGNSRWDHTVEVANKLNRLALAAVFTCQWSSASAAWRILPPQSINRQHSRSKINIFSILLFWLENSIFESTSRSLTPGALAVLGPELLKRCLPSSSLKFVYILRSSFGSSLSSLHSEFFGFESTHAAPASFGRSKVASNRSQIFQLFWCANHLFLSFIFWASPLLSRKPFCPMRLIWSSGSERSKQIPGCSTVFCSSLSNFREKVRKLKKKL